jgi:hypothetical protein
MADLKTILNNVLGQSTFIKRDNFTSSSATNDVQMVDIANQVAYELKDAYNWGELRKPWTLEIIDEQTVYPLPLDWNGVVPDSGWQTEGSRQIELPVPGPRWYMYKFSTFSDGGTLRCRLYGGNIEIHDPGTTSSFTLEYLTKYPILSSTMEAKEFFTADTDVFLLDDMLLTLGVKAYWQREKQMPSADKNWGNYQTKLNEAIGRSTGGRTIGGYDGSRFGYNRRSPYYPLYRSGG